MGSLRRDRKPGRCPAPPGSPRRLSTSADRRSKTAAAGPFVWRSPKNRWPFQLVPVIALAIWDRLPKVLPFQAKPSSRTMTRSSFPCHSRTNSAPAFRPIPSRVCGSRRSNGAPAPSLSLSPRRAAARPYRDRRIRPPADGSPAPSTAATAGGGPALRRRGGCAIAGEGLRVEAFQAGEDPRQGSVEPKTKHPATGSDALLSHALARRASALMPPLSPLPRVDGGAACFREPGWRPRPHSGAPAIR